MSWFSDVLQFHTTGGAYVGKTPEIPDTETLALRKRLILEEIEETLKAIDQRDLVAMADGLLDVIFVIIGTGVSCGLDLPTLWNEVHRTNMAKFKNGVIKDEGGKILKPEGWEPPDLAGLIATQQPITNLY